MSSAIAEGGEWARPSDLPFTSLPVSELAKGDRRLEGETYLTGGYRIQRDFETSGAPFARLKELATTWQPSRLKGVTVSRQDGEPFLTATQVFDIRPAARKWLASSRTTRIDDRYVQPGWILVTCSGSVGDVILSYSPHASAVISHDLLRVQPHDERLMGYLYAFLRGNFGRTMMRSSRYGNIIKHLEPEHLDEIPVPLIDIDIARMLSARVRKIFQLRDEAFLLLRDAEAMFAKELGQSVASDQDVTGYSIHSTDMFRRQRRLDGYHYNPTASAVLHTLLASGKPVEPLSNSVSRVFGVARFKHVYADQGIPYLDSEDLFKINPELTKFIPKVAKTDAANYYVQKDWILMASSGQLYGLNGSVVLADTWHENKIVSNHVMRIVPDGVRPGYLQIALGHPNFGRPMVLRYAFGTEVPEISPDAMRDFPLVRLDQAVENEIAERVETASSLRMQADKEEDGVVLLVDEMIRNLIQESEIASSASG